jgi:hypothetical protein
MKAAHYPEPLLGSVSSKMPNMNALRALRHAHRLNPELHGPEHNPDSFAAGFDAWPQSAPRTSASRQVNPEPEIDRATHANKRAARWLLFPSLLPRIMAGIPEE